MTTEYRREWLRLWGQWDSHAQTRDAAGAGQEIRHAVAGNSACGGKRFGMRGQQIRHDRPARAGRVSARKKGERYTWLAKSLFNIADFPHKGIHQQLSFLPHTYLVNNDPISPPYPSEDATQANSKAICRRIPIFLMPMRSYETVPPPSPYLLFPAFPCGTYFL